MVITILSGPFDGSKSYIAYFSVEDCRRATATISDTIVTAYDHKFECIESDTQSGSISPKRRP